MRRLATIGLVVLWVSGLGPGAIAGEGIVPGLPVDLALGNSWAQGEGAADRATGGYVGRSYELFKKSLDCVPSASEAAADGCKHLQLVNLGEGGGITTADVIAEQLPTAVELLGARNGDANPANDVVVVTLTAGGNDVYGPVLAACLGGLSPACLEAIHTILAEVEANLEVILAGLRDSAGAGIPIVVTTYDNPIPTCRLAAIPGAILLGDLVLEGGIPGVVEEGLNDVIRGVAANHGVAVADVFGLLAPEDWVGGNDCLHTVDSGHEKIAQAVVEVVGG